MQVNPVFSIYKMYFMLIYSVILNNCYACSFNTACAAARRATGTLYGEQLT
jgi:hypothetical protein